MTAEANTTTYTVSAQVRPGGDAFANARTSILPFDATAQSGDVLPGPADLLCVALSACILKNVERFSHILPFRYESASIEVSADREAPPPRIVRMHYHLRIVSDEPANRVDLLHKNIRRCGTITSTLAAACEVTGEIEAVSAEAPA